MESRLTVDVNRSGYRKLIDYPYLSADPCGRLPCPCSYLLCCSWDGKRIVPRYIQGFSSTQTPYISECDFIPKPIKRTKNPAVSHRLFSHCCHRHSLFLPRCRHAMQPPPFRWGIDPHAALPPSQHPDLFLKEEGSPFQSNRPSNTSRIGGLVSNIGWKHRGQQPRIVARHHKPSRYNSHIVREAGATLRPTRATHVATPSVAWSDKFVHTPSPLQVQLSPDSDRAH